MRALLILAAAIAAGCATPTVFDCRPPAPPAVLLEVPAPLPPVPADLPRR